jgi:hypothetical protein
MSLCAKAMENAMCRFVTLVMGLSILVLGATLAVGGDKGDTTKPQPPEAVQEQFKEQLDRIVMSAEKKASSQLAEKVTSPEQALSVGFVKDYKGQYRVFEHKGWWVVAWCGDARSDPVFWLPGLAIRKDSKDVYRFGSW